MKKSLKIGIAVGMGLFVMAGTTHIWMPSSMDDCQADISHKDNLWSLAPFHCINHTEFAYDTDAEGNEIIVWDHLHFWMTTVWFLEHGFSAEEAKTFIGNSKD